MRPTRAHLGVPTRAIKGGRRGEGRPNQQTLAAPSVGTPSLSLSAAPPLVHQALLILADLAIRSATLLLLRVDFVEVQRLLHKDELF